MLHTSSFSLERLVNGCCHRVFQRAEELEEVQQDRGVTEAPASSTDTEVTSLLVGLYVTFSVRAVLVKHKCPHVLEEKLVKDPGQCDLIIHHSGFQVLDHNSDGFTS